MAIFLNEVAILTFTVAFSPNYWVGVLALIFFTDTYGSIGTGEFEI